MLNKTIEPQKLYYTTGEVAAMLNVNPSLIRFWEKEFTSLKPQKTSKGNRQFSNKDIEQLKLIYHLVKERGLTIKGAQKKLKENKTGVVQNQEITEKLQQIKNYLIELRNELSSN